MWGSGCIVRRGSGQPGHGGQVLLSSTTKELAEEDLPAGVSIIDLGERRLKDLDQPQHALPAGDRRAAG